MVVGTLAAFGVVGTFEATVTDKTEGGVSGFCTKPSRLFFWVGSFLVVRAFFFFTEDLGVTVEAMDFFLEGTEVTDFFKKEQNWHWHPESSTSYFPVWPWPISS